ncbi:MAG: LytTR family DNA-binding domain-containing protein [Bacteroidota bacterium]
MQQPTIPSLIVDDEASSRENISILLEQFCPEVKVVGVAANLRQATQLITDQRPQLVFLDVQLGADTAFMLLKQLGAIDFEIIFITAHNHYALKAFEFMAVDYLLKPVEIPALIKAVTNAGKRLASKSLHLSMEQMMMHVEDFNRDRHKLALATGKGYEMVYIRDITYCLADGSYTHFYFRNGEELVVSKNLKYYENLLVPYGFIRSHNTTLINLQYVKTIERTGGGALVMEDGKTLPVTKARRQELEARIKNDRRLF